MLKNILITAGPTVEPIDPARYLTNRSTGKMGYALAKACVKAGHRVTLISGPTQLKRPRGCRFIAVTTARQMHRAVIPHARHSHIIFKTAAVADYGVKRPAKKKIKKGGQTLHLELTRNPDILKDLGRKKKAGQVLVGFAAETHDGLNLALKKLRDKNLDWIVLNDVSRKDVGFASDFNEVTLIARDGKRYFLPKQNKRGIAKKILHLILK